jgi:hypothetical protein
MRSIVIFAASILFLVTGCRKPQEPEGYRVTSYDAATHQWTIIRTGTFDGKFLRKRLIVRCTSYKWADKQAVEGPEACHLQVGRLIVPNQIPAQGHDNEFIDVYEMPSETLSISEGRGADEVMQQFDILHYDVLPDEK